MLEAKVALFCKILQKTKYKDAKLQKYKNTKVLKYKNATKKCKDQCLQNTKKYKNTKIQKLKNTKYKNTKTEKSVLVIKAAIEWWYIAANPGTRLPTALLVTAFLALGLEWRSQYHHHHQNQEQIKKYKHAQI